jgi:hypothetical protein
MNKNVQTGESNVVYIQRELQSLKFTTGDIDAHIYKVTSLLQDLETFGSAQNEEMQVSYLLCTLDSHFDSMVQAISAPQIVANGGYDGVVAQVREVWRRLEASELEIAMFSQQKPTSSSSRQREPKGKNNNSNTSCWVCGRKGHISRDCRNRANPNSDVQPQVVKSPVDNCLDVFTSLSDPTY